MEPTVTNCSNKENKKNRMLEKKESFLSCMLKKMESLSICMLTGLGYLISAAMILFTVYYTRFLPIEFDSILDIFFILSAFVYLFVIIYALTSRALLVLLATSIAPAVLLASFIDWEYKDFIEQYLLKPVFGGASVIGVLATHFKDLEKKKKDEAKKAEAEAKKAEDEAKKAEAEAKKAEAEAKKAEAEAEAKKAEAEAKKAEAEAKTAAEAAAKAEAEIEVERAKVVNLQREEMLMHDTQRSLQNREMEFKLTIEFRNRVIQDVISYLAPIIKDNRSGEFESKEDESYAGLISEAKKIVYDVYMYFNSITIVKMVVRLINKRFSGNAVSDDDVLTLIHEFRKRLDFQSEEKHLKELSKELSKILVEGISLPDGISKGYAENLLFGFFLKEGIPSYKDVIESLGKKYLKQEEADAKLSSLIGISVRDRLRVVMEDFKIILTDDIIEKFIDEIFKSKRAKEGEQKEIKDIRHVVDISLTEMIKAELGLKGISGYKFLRLKRTNENNQKKHYAYNWLRLRLSPSIYSSNREDWSGDVLAGFNLEDGIENELIFVWSKNNEKVGSSLLGLFVIGQGGKIKKRIVRNSVTQDGILKLAESKLPSSIINELLNSKGETIIEGELNKSFLDSLPNVFDALGNEMASRPQESKKDIKAEVVGHKEVKHKTLIVPFGDIIDTTLLSYIRDSLDNNTSGGMICAYGQDVYKVRAFELKPNENGTIPMNQVESREIMFSAMPSLFQKEVMNLNVHFTLEWSEDDDLDGDQNDKGISGEVYFSYNPKSTPAQIELRNCEDLLT